MTVDFNRLCLSWLLQPDSNMTSHPFGYTSGLYHSRGFMHVSWETWRATTENQNQDRTQCQPTAPWGVCLRVRGAPGCIQTAARGERTPPQTSVPVNRSGASPCVRKGWHQEAGTCCRDCSPDSELRESATRAQLWPPVKDDCWGKLQEDTCAAHTLRTSVILTAQVHKPPTCSLTDWLIDWSCDKVLP